MSNIFNDAMEAYNATTQTELSSVFKVSPDSRLKALMNWQGVVIWDDEVDPVDLLHAYLKRAADESCGQCTPCRLGTWQLATIMDKVLSGRGRVADLERITQLACHISQTARCDIGKTLAKPVVDLILEFRQEFLDVIEGRREVRKGNYHATVTAPCVSACPSHVDIPAYLEGIRMGNFSDALATVRKDCPLPGTIGRVCVRPCEANCRRGALDKPLAIRALKRFLSDRELMHKEFPDKPLVEAKPQKIAIIGAGPAGLSCAYYLGQRGYQCTIFEAQEGPGGMAAYGIPSYRLPRDILAYEVSVVETQGATIQYNTRIGEDITIEELGQQGYQAVFIGVGAPEASKMRCEGEDAGYQCFMTGVTFLAEAARGGQPLTGEKLLVIGGGNVAMDCVRTARRIGFKDINLLYRRTEAEMPADPQEIEEAKEEGVVFHHLVAPIRVIAEDGKVKGLECQRMELGEPDQSGRRRPVPIKDSNFIILCDAIVPAVGQVCVVDCVLPDEDSLTRWKTLVVDEETFQSKQPHVFGGGDCITGPATLIAALAAGKNAARFMAEYLETGQCRKQISD
ncbi:MAG: FAD-dependent oxidoreductase, partial [Desulfobacteraceae bacterium]